MHYAIIEYGYPTFPLAYMLTYTANTSPPFATLAIVQIAGGLIRTGCDIFFCDYALPSGAPPTTSCRGQRI